MDPSSTEGPNIPYRFMPMPHELFTEDFISDPIMVRFVTCMMKRISPYSKSIPIKNRRKQLFLAAFEFMFGREKFALDAGISSKNAYTRLKQLIGLGYVEEVITKKDSNYSVYRLVTEAFQQIGGQHKGQVLGQKSGQLNEHKQETKIARNKDIKGTIYVKDKVFRSSLSENQAEEFIGLKIYCESHHLQIYETSLLRWISRYGTTYISDHLPLLIQAKDRIKNHEAWMEKALRENYVQKNKNVQINQDFIKNFLKRHKWPDLKVTKAYCIHLPSSKDYRFDLSPENFQKMIEECFLLYEN